MAQLDRLLSVVAGNRADGLRIVQDGPAMLLKGGTQQPVTRQALTVTQVMALVREVAPEDATQRIQRGEAAQFEYAFGNDVYTASARFDNGQLTVEVAPVAVSDASPARGEARLESADLDVTRCARGTP